MSEDEESKSAAGQWIIIVAVSLVFYVFSIGPAVALLEKFPPSPVLEKFLEAFYFPLLLTEHTSFGNLLDQYVQWCCKLVR